VTSTDVKGALLIHLIDLLSFSYVLLVHCLEIRILRWNKRCILFSVRDDKEKEFDFTDRDKKCLSNHLICLNFSCCMPAMFRRLQVFYFNTAVVPESTVAVGERVTILLVCSTAVAYTCTQIYKK
jgi:hypothetical protein